MNGKAIFVLCVALMVFFCFGCTPKEDREEYHDETKEPAPGLQEPKAEKTAQETQGSGPEDIPLSAQEPTLESEPNVKSSQEQTGTVGTRSLFYNGFTPATGRGIAPPDGKNGPWSTRAVLASSPDGITFTSTGEVIADQAGVPNLIVDHEGYLRLYYQAWQDKGTMGGNDGNFMAMAIKDPDSKWYFHRLVLDRTFKAMPVDPSVVLLPDGTYRLYFMADVGQMNLRIFSAVSDDGVQFSIEEGFRMTPNDNQGIFDPMVLQTSQGWLLIAGGGGKYSATSIDGLEFTDALPFTAGGKPYHAWAGVQMPDDRGFRLYGNFLAPPKFSTLYSEDGISWTDVGFDLKGGIATDVGVAALPDGTYHMVYLDPIP